MLPFVFGSKEQNVKSDYSYKEEAHFIMCLKHKDVVESKAGTSVTG